MTLSGYLRNYLVNKKNDLFEDDIKKFELLETCSIY